VRRRLTLVDVEYLLSRYTRLSTHHCIQYVLSRCRAQHLLAPTLRLGCQALLFEEKRLIIVGAKMAEEANKYAHSVSPRSSEDSIRSTPSRTPSTHRAHNSSPSQSHRQSFTEHLRGMPPSPRQNRHLSFSQAQMQELLNNPPTAGSADPAFAGRDWQTIGVGELVNPQDLRFVELDTGVEAATNVGCHIPFTKLPDVSLISAAASDRIWCRCSARPFESTRTIGRGNLRL